MDTVEWHTNPWAGILHGSPYLATLKPGRSARSQAVELFDAWAYRVSGGIHVDPSQVTEVTAEAFCEWMTTTDIPPDCRHDLVNGRSGPAWGEVWASVARLTNQLGRPPTMRDVYRDLSADFCRRITPRGRREVDAVQEHLHEFVRRYHAWVEQSPKGRVEVADRVRGAKPSELPMEAVSIIVKPTRELSGRYACGVARSLKYAWRDMGLDNNPWTGAAKAMERLTKDTPPVYEREATSAHVQRLLSQPDVRTLEGARDFAVIAASVFWGVRAAELISIQRQDFFRSAEDGKVYVRIHSSRNGQDRILPVTDRMLRALERLTVLIEERASRVKGPMVKWAKHVLAPDSPLFPSLFRWKKGSTKAPGVPLRPNAVYEILIANDKSSPRPTEIRRYMRRTLRDLGVQRKEINYILAGYDHAPHNVEPRRVEQAIVAYEAWVSREAKLVW